MTQPPPPPPHQPPSRRRAARPAAGPAAPAAGVRLSAAPRRRRRRRLPQAPAGSADPAGGTAAGPADAYRLLRGQHPGRSPQPPGYGYPGQQRPSGSRGPYGQQPGQPGYGQPGTGSSPVTAIRSRPCRIAARSRASRAAARSSTRSWPIIVAAVVAIALIIGGGVWYASSGDERQARTTPPAPAAAPAARTTTNGGTEPPAARRRCRPTPAPRSSSRSRRPRSKNDSTVVVSGSWLTDKAYAKSGIAEIVGYDPDKGSKQWTIPLAGPVCQASQPRHRRQPDGDRLPARDADQGRALARAAARSPLIDLDAGKKLWTKTVKTGDQPISFDNVTSAANTVAVGSTSGGAAFDIAPASSCGARSRATPATTPGTAAARSWSRCASAAPTTSAQLHIQTIDPKSGKVISEYKMAEGIEYASIVSTDPLVVAADVGDSAGDGSGISDFFSIDNKTGKLRTRISVPGEQFAARCDGITRSRTATGSPSARTGCTCRPRSTTAAGEYSQTNEIVAFDLATGKQTGQRADAGDGYTISPLRMDGGNLIAYKRPPYDKGGQIVSIDGGQLQADEAAGEPGDGRGARRGDQHVAGLLRVPATRRGICTCRKVYASKRSAARREGVPGGRLRYGADRPAIACSMRLGDRLMCSSAPSLFRGGAVRVWLSRPRIGEEFGDPGRFSPVGERNVEQACSFRGHEGGGAGGLPSGGLG